MRVVTSLAGRSEDSAKRAKAAGMVAVSDQELARADYFLSILPPSDALALAEKMAALIGPSNHKPIYVDCNAVSPPTKIEIGHVIIRGGFAVRRCRHHRRRRRRPAMTARAIYASGPDAGRFALAQRVRARGPRDERADRRRLGDEDVLRRHHQGLHRARRHDDAGGARAAAWPKACARSWSAASRRCCPGCSARSRRCTPRPIASSARWRRSRTTSARTSRRRRCSTPSPISTRGSPPTSKASRPRSARSTAFLKPKQ